MTEKLDALADSVQRLRRIADGLVPEQVALSAYPTEWSIADTFSHIGSGAVIARTGFEAALNGSAVPDDFNQSVWDEWNAKEPVVQVREAVVADEALLAALQGSSADDRAGFHLSLGPMELDFDGLVGLRLNEHALHTWDIEVALDPDAPVGPVPASFVIDGLGMIASFTAKPTGDERTIVVTTTDPARTFTISLRSDAVQVTAGPAVDAGPAAVTTVEMPAEAFIRLVYGRLDPDHTPELVDPDGVVDALRRVFPGF